jgi:hypothetical protein
MGDRVHAARHYAKFLEMWKDSDPELKPLRDAAARKLSQLNR